MEPQPTALVRDPTSAAPRWWRFERPSEVVSVDRIEDVVAAVGRIEAAADRGLYAVGFLGYEAAPAFDRALEVHEESPLPLLWFGLFDAPRRGERPPAPDRSALVLDWTPSLSAEEHAAAVAEIREAIADGSTYQVNLTYRLRAPYVGDPTTLFARLQGAQPTPYAAYIDTGRHVVASASPELFFSLRGERIVSRPMKGTAPRGRFAAEDEARAASLAASQKDRAENLMIVDMARNDLGRIAQPGSVEVPRLFGVERYATVLQLVSEVEARTDRPLADILAAMFPAASITGAPKPSTMRWIRRLESAPRGIYTGTIATIRPGRQADFSVAIRTAHIDRRRATVEYGTGGGIVWDSDRDSEWSETRTKALILTAPTPDFQLLETLRWSPAGGFHRLGLHRDRVMASAAYFGFRCRTSAIERALERAAEAWRSTPAARIVRVLVDADGGVEVEDRPLDASSSPWRVGICASPVDSSDRFLFHKTTERRVYREALAASPGCDDVLLFNERGEWTESTRANLVVVVDGVAYTPPVECGLLAGTEREHRIRIGELVVRPVRNDDLGAASEIYLVNSVRGRIEIERPELLSALGRAQ